MNSVRAIVWKINTPLTRVALVVLPTVALLSQWMTPYMSVASLAYFLMISGLYYKRHRLVHARLMSTSMFLDILLVLVLEFQRAAVQTVIAHRLNTWQMTHVGFSLLAVLLYLPVGYMGWQRFQRRASEKQEIWHFRLGITAFVFRTLGYAFMFSMLK